MNIPQEQLEKTFNQANEFKPLNFSDWSIIHNYVDIALAEDSVKSIITNDEKTSREKCALIYEQWKQDGVDKLHKTNISKIEATSLYYNFIDLQLIHDAFKEMENKHSSLPEIKHKCDEEGKKSWKNELVGEAVKHEKDLHEISKRLETIVIQAKEFNPRSLS